MEPILRRITFMREMEKLEEKLKEEIAELRKAIEKSIEKRDEFIKKIENKKVVEYLDKDNPDIPKECNRYTNTPCEWSNTNQMDDTCRVCGRTFPTWC